MKHLISLLIVLAVSGTKALALVPYTKLSDNQTKITFYYDNQPIPGFDITWTVTQPGEKSWGGDKGRVKTIVFDKSFAKFTAFTSTANWFKNFRELETIIGLENLNTVNVTDMHEMFSQCFSLSSLDLSGLNTSNVTDMHEMFYLCQSLTSLDLSSFNTSKVTNMERMFTACHSLTNINLSSFDTSNVTNMAQMFSQCECLTGLDLSSFKTPNVTNMMGLCGRCASMTVLDLSNFDTANVLCMISMFYGCTSLRTIYGSDWNTSKVEDSLWMFHNCIHLEGGQGTHCIVRYEGENGHLYARIDGGKDAPGLFTAKGQTDIQAATDSRQNDAPVYSLSGLRLNAPQKGINIIGGRKVVIK